MKCTENTYKNIIPNLQTQLFLKIGKWIQEIVKGMTKKYDKDVITEATCENIGETDQEKKVCTFILQNLWKIKEMSKIPCESRSAEEVLRDYVHCTTLNLWRAMYISDHCDKNRVVENVYNAMKSMGATFSRPGTCNVCEYKELGAMDIVNGNLNVLNTIYSSIKGNNEVMNLINTNITPQKQCPGQDDPLTKLGLSGNSNNGMRTSGLRTTMNDHQQSNQQPSNEAGNVARSAEPGSNNKTFNGFQSGGEYVFTLTRGKPSGMTITPVAGGGSIEHGGAVIMTFGTDAALPGTDDMSNGVIPVSTTRSPTGSPGDGQKTSLSLEPNVEVGPMGDPFTDFLVKWIERRGIWDDEGFKKIWDDLRGMSEKLINALSKEDEIIKEFCENDLEDEIQIEDNHKSMCKNLMKIFYFMQGLRTEGMDGVKGNEEEEKEKAFMRCIVGSVAMFKVFKKYCWFEDYLDYALRVTEPQRAALGVPDSYGKCAWMNFEEVRIGTKLIGERVAQWIEEKESVVAGYGNLSKTNNAPWCMNSRVTKEKKKNKEKGENRAQEWTEGKEMKEVQEVVENGTYITGESQKNLFLKIKEGKLQGINKIEEEINKEIQRQRTPPPSILTGECASANFEEGEEAQWDELFTKFSNNPTEKEDSKDYKYSKLEMLFPWCDEIKDEDKGNMGRYQEFCKVLLKNLLMVNNNPYYCEKNSSTHTGQRKACVGKCDLLNIWLMYVRDHCVPSEVIKYVFTGMHSMKDTLPGTEKYANCAYLSIKNLWRDGNDMLNLIMKWMQGGKCGRKMDDVDTKGWCKGGGNKLSNVKLSRKDNANWDNNANAALNEFMEELKEGSEIVNILKADQGNFGDKIKEVKKKVEMKKQSLLDFGPSLPASDGKEEKGGEESQEKGTKKSDSEKPAHAVPIPEKPQPKPAGTKDTAQTEDTGKSTTSPKKKPTKEQCASGQVDGDGEEAMKCLSLDGDGDPLSTEPSVALPDEDQEAKPGGVGPVGRAGSSPDDSNPQGTVDLKDPQIDIKVPKVDISRPKVDISVPTVGEGSPAASTPHTPQAPDNEMKVSASPPTPELTSGGISSGKAFPSTKTAIHNPSPRIQPGTRDEENIGDSTIPSIPLIPVFIGTVVIGYLLTKYFGMLGKGRKRYRRAPQIRGPPLEEQPLDYVDQQDGPHEYTLVRERKQPRSTPQKRRKQVGKRGVGRRTIIDIHLEVLDECQKGDTKLVQEDFFEILVQEFMGSGFIEEENAPKEKVLSSYSGFREEDFFP
ncbi:SICA antigen [Plasmodium coatneyi]|uniref:SICA antigen n=1 Tax=Plasmodium coatneyi TaxID=208452 RepID=A0A1B1DUN1_9APIC|nr:SICA antigen [Plasmodium coatneyi]ANQ06483.1 SICA antigen [Plasmodium coatneyi]